MCWHSAFKHIASADEVVFSLQRWREKGEGEKGYEGGGEFTGEIEHDVINRQVGGGLENEKERQSHRLHCLKTYVPLSKKLFCY
jgi:hypothetical protein